MTVQFEIAHLLINRTLCITQRLLLYLLFQHFAVRAGVCVRERMMMCVIMMMTLAYVELCTLIMLVHISLHAHSGRRGSDAFRNVCVLVHE